MEIPTLDSKTSDSDVKIVETDSEVRLVDEVGTDPDAMPISAETGNPSQP
ncbi:MAG: hypothetical protein R3C11_02295 [Planctomycetaceae bacterium]